MDPFIGQIQAFGFNFAPTGWAECNGQLLAISSNSALYSLLGTIYGGDGFSTFGLPDLRGRVMIHRGTGPGLSTYNIGSKINGETVTLAESQLPSHSHVLNASSDLGTTNDPVDKVLGNSGIFDNEFAVSANLVNMSSTSIGNTGGGVPVDIRQPSLTINVCIALFGIFPSRS